MSVISSEEVEQWLDSNPLWFQSYALRRLDLTLVTRWLEVHGYRSLVAPSSPCPDLSGRESRPGRDSTEGSPLGSARFRLDSGVFFDGCREDKVGERDKDGGKDRYRFGRELGRDWIVERDRVIERDRRRNSETRRDENRHTNDRHKDPERDRDQHRDTERDRETEDSVLKRRCGSFSLKAICLDNSSPGGRRDSTSASTSPSPFQTGDFGIFDVPGRTGSHHHRSNSRKHLRRDFARSRIRSLVRGAHEPSISFEQDATSDLAERRSSLKGMRQFLSLPIATASSTLSLLIQSKVRLPRYATKNDDFKRELRRENARDFFLEIVRDVSIDLDLDSLTNRVLVNIAILVGAERSAICFVEGAKGNQRLVARFFTGNADERFTTVRTEVSNAASDTWGSGIIGHVAETGSSVNLKDARQDPRYKEDFYRKSWRSSDGIEVLMERIWCPRSLLCMPIHNPDGDVIAIAQVANKVVDGGRPGLEEVANGREELENGDIEKGTQFAEDDEKLLETYMAFCGMAISNAQAIEAYTKEYDRNRALLEVVHDLFEEQTTVEKVVTKIMERAQGLLKCERCVVLLEENQENNISTSGIGQLFDLQQSAGNGNGLATGNGNGCVTSTSRCNSPSLVIRQCNNATNSSSSNSNADRETDMTSLTKEGVNLSENQLDAIFSVASGRVGGYTCQSVLCKPIRNSSFQTIGAAQLINRLDGKPFDENDERLFEAFTIFCGLGINNCLVYDEKAIAAAKQAVALEVISYHASVSPDQVILFKNMVVPPAAEWHIDSPVFNDFSLDNDQMVVAAVRIFQETGLVKTFKIDYETLIRWLLTVRKNYRDVAYHNWRHAFNVSQFMFTVLQTCGMRRHLSDLECLALIVACLCHDLDHRGTNNAFQQKSSSALSQLYGTQATLEHHHFNHAVMILNSDKHNNIFSNLSSEDYGQVMHLLKLAILATDLSLHMQVRKRFFPLVESGEVNWSDGRQRELLRSVLMTTCDIGAITKPWATQVRVADLVVMEFFDQGDKEKAMLNIQPPAIMDRERRDELPNLQLEWIDGICLPLYRSLATLNKEFDRMVENVLRNRQQWQTSKLTGSAPDDSLSNCTDEM